MSTILAPQISSHPDEQAILIVDDNPTNLGVIADFLEGYGFTILVARDGESALERVHYGQPDLILLDVMMPGIDGFETCRRLKADELTRDIPVIFMTALASVEDKVKGFELGAVDYVTKPVQQEEVLVRITTHLRLRSLTHEVQEAHQQTQTILDETTMLYGVITHLNAASTLKEIIQAAATPAIHAGSVGAGLFLFELDEAGQPEAVEFVEAWEADPPLKIGTRFHLPDFPLANLWLADPHNVLLIGDVERDERVDPASREVLLQIKAWAIVLMALKRGDRWIGELAFRWETPQIFTEADQRLYNSVATQAAITMDNRLLFEQTQQRAEELKETTSFLDSIVENIPSMLFVKDAESLSFVRFNKAGETLIGVGREEMLGKNDYDFFSKEEADFFTAKDQHVLAKGELVDIPEEALQTAHGDVRLLHTKKVPILGREGRPRYLLGISEDITERKQAEQALREVSELQKAILDNASYAIISTTAEGIITTFNPAAEQLLGYTAYELVGKETLMLIHDLSEVVERAQHFSTELGLNIEPGFEVFVAKARLDLPNEHEWTYIRKDNYHIPVLLSVTALRDDVGNITGFLGIAQDITTRKEAEAKLEKLAIELATVAQISTNISIIAEPQEMLQNVVDLTKESFDLYHAHIYLLNDTEDTLVLTAGAGEVGRQMVAERWYISLEEKHSFVARAARQRQSEISNNVRESPDFLANLLLPNTRSEMAVPMIAGDKLFGVLDVQADSLNRFTAEDVQIQTTLAAQVAVALQNTRLFEQSERAIHELNALNRRLGNEAWQEYRDKQTAAPGYVYDLQKLLSINDFKNGSLRVPPEASKIETSLRVGSTEIGRLELIEPYQQKDEASRIVEAVAQRLSAHVENLRLTEETQAALAETESQARRLAFLNEIATALSYTLDERQIFEVIATNVNRIINSDRLSVAFILPDKQELEIILLNESGEAISTGTYLPLEGTAVGKAIAENRILTMADIAEDDFIDYLQLLQQGMHSVLLAPLITSQGQSIGTLNISSREIDIYTAQDVNLWRQLASLVASTIENRRLLTQMQQVLTDVQQSQELLRTVIDATPDWIFVKDRDHRFRLVNKGFADSLHLTTEEIVGKTDLALGISEEIVKGNPEKGIKGFWPDDDEVIASGVIKSVDIEPTVIEGETRYLSTIKVPIRDAEGAVTGVLGYARDVTERERLLAEVQRLASIVENHPDFVGVGTMSGQALYINPSGLKMMGLPPGHDVSTMKASDFYGIVDAQKLLENGVPTALAEGSWSAEVDLRRVDGTWLPVEETIGINYDSEGIPTSFSITMRDIRERRQAEQELRKLSQAVEQSPTVVIITDTAGIIEYVNPKFTELTGYTSQEAVGQNPRILKSGDMSTDAYRTLWAAILSGQEWRGELHNVKKNGDSYWASVSISPVINIQGEITHFLSVQEDISERKLAEVERERLLNEVQTAYRQYVRREWQELLGDQHQDRWYIEHRRADLPSVDQGELRSTSLSTPIAILGEVIGTLSLEDIDPNREWTSEEVALVETVSEQLGLTIENLRLFEGTQKQATREQLTRRITDKMRASPDIDSIVKTGLSELAQALGVSRTYLKLTTPEPIDLRKDDIEAIRRELKNYGQTS